MISMLNNAFLFKFHLYANAVTIIIVRVIANFFGGILWFRSGHFYQAFNDCVHAIAPILSLKR